MNTKSKIDQYVKSLYDAGYAVGYATAKMEDVFREVEDRTEDDRSEVQTTKAPPAQRLPPGESTRIAIQALRMLGNLADINAWYEEAKTLGLTMALESFRIAVVGKLVKKETVVKSGKNFCLNGKTISTTDVEEVKQPEPAATSTRMSDSSRMSESSSSSLPTFR